MSTEITDSSKRDEGESHRCQPSRGWKRWFILAGLFMVSFLEVGSTRTLSLFLDDFTFQFDVSTSYMGTIYGLISGMPYFLALVNIPLLRFFSVRQLVIFGGILVSGGLVGGSYSRSAPEITVALIAFGLGFVFIVLPTNSCPADYFPDRFEVANGVFISGGSVGVMVMPLLFDTLIDLYGWRGGLLLLGGFTIHVTLIGSLLKITKTKRARDATPHRNEVSGHVNVHFEPDPLEMKTGESWMKDRSETVLCNPREAEYEITIFKTVPSSKLFENEEQSAHAEHGSSNEQSKGSKFIQVTDDADAAVTCNESKTDVRRKSSTNGSCDQASSPVNASSVNLEIEDTHSINKRCSCNCISSTVRFFKEHPLMIIVCIQVYLFALPYGTWLLFTIPNAQAKGLSDLRATQLSVAGGIANFLGRFTCGFITSRNLARIEVWYMVANIISSTAFFVNYVADTFWFLLILSLLFGFTIGFKAPAQFTLVMKAVGQEYFKTGLGILFLCGGSAFPILGFIAGAIYDRTQSYNIAFCIMGALDVFAAILIITPVAWQWLRKPPTQNNNNITG